VSVTIVNGEAIDAAGVLPGETERGRGASTARRKNHLLRRARLTQRSPSGSGLAMSRPELAEAVNAHVYATSGRIVSFDANHVGKLERGEIHWPSALYRAALCAVLGAARSADLGFYITRVGVDPDPPEPEPESEPDESAATTTAEQGPSLLRTILAERHWQVFRTFRAHFERAARELAEHEGDPTLRTLDVSERQFRRWLQGVRPLPDACRVLESMFGHPIARLIGPAVPGATVPGADIAPTVEPATRPGRAVTGPDAGAGSAVRVSVTAQVGTAVTVVCDDDAAGRVAVVAGGVPVLIDASGADPASLAPAVADVPAVAGGARLYSLAERRAR
jgi:hypothetical protein